MNKRTFLSLLPILALVLFGAQGVSATIDSSGTTAQGILVQFRYAPDGEVDGFYLDDGTEVHFPPHLGSQVASIVSVGARVSVTGYLHTGPAGDTHLEAATITNLDTGASLSIMTTVEGTLTQFRHNLEGIADGFYLDGGMEVHFPPHLTSQVTAILSVGSHVSVTGYSHTGPASDTHIDAQTITNLDTGASVTVSEPPPPPGNPLPPPPGGPPPPHPPGGITTTVEGAVVQFRYNPEGLADGFYLDDGTEVHFPPHLSSQVTAVIAVGTPVRVTGRQHIGPAGDTHVDAAKITNLQTGATVVVSEAPPPPPPPPGNPPPPPSGRNIQRSVP